jgi:hypothetical protein
MPDSGERRARRKLLAEAYNSLPSRELLQAAAELERAKMQRSSQSEQMALQKGSLAVAVLSQVPRDNEDNKPLFVDARNLLHEILQRGIAETNSSATNEEDDDLDDLDDTENMETLG